MPRIAAGILMFRRHEGVLQVLLAHPGGPFFRHRDDGVWTIPKGEPDEGEDDLLRTARREFQEETGIVPEGDCVALQPITQKGGKVVYAWAMEGDCDPTTIQSNEFTIEWPPHSGQQVQFPEVDRVEFFDLKAARTKIKAAQRPLIDELDAMLKRRED